LRDIWDERRGQSTIADLWSFLDPDAAASRSTVWIFAICDGRSSARAGVSRSSAHLFNASIAENIAYARPTPVELKSKQRDALPADE